MKFVPKSLARLRASRFAREQFYAQNVHNTVERSGILIFVSVAERYVEIIGDQGINDVIAKNEWRDIVNQFVRDVKSQHLGDGFVTAINSCGDKLTTHFPIRDGDKNELPNRIIIL